MRKRKFARPLTALMAMTPAILAAGIGCKDAGRHDVTKIVEFRSYTLRPGALRSTGGLWSNRFPCFNGGTSTLWRTARRLRTRLKNSIPTGA
jgi:hypothetical protein